MIHPKMVGKHNCTKYVHHTKVPDAQMFQVFRLIIE